MVWIFSIACILLCAVIGAAFGALRDSRAIFIVGSYIPTYTVLGVLWGVSLAYNYLYDKKKYKDKGVLLTETKEYNKKRMQKKKKKKTDE